MCAAGRPVTLLLLHLISSASSSPVSTLTPAPPLPWQVVAPALSPSSSPPLGDSAVGCPLTVSPSTLVVRFGDPAKANCSVSQMGFSLLGWEVSLAAPDPTMDGFLVWHVDRLTDWGIRPICYALADTGGRCDIALPLIVYKPPNKVSISVNHTGPMMEGHRYTLQCTVEDVAPVKNLFVTFYRGQTALGLPQSINSTEEKPVTQNFPLDINPGREDNGAEYWCEAKLELGPEGPKLPLLVTSKKITTIVLFGPWLSCPTKLQVREGESLRCEVGGNPSPLVTWFRDGQVVALPTHSSRKDAGKYTVSATGRLGQKNFTVEVEVLPASGNTNSCNEHFLLAILLIQMINWL
ncbi:icam2 [Pungitius sinensis]